MNKYLAVAFCSITAFSGLKSQTYLPLTGGTLSGNLAINGSLTGTYSTNVPGLILANTYNHNPTMSPNSNYTALRLFTNIQSASTGNNGARGIDSRIFNQQNTINSGGIFVPISSSFSDQSGGTATALNVMNYNAVIGELSAGSNISYYTMYGGGNGPTTLAGTITNFMGFDLAFPYNNAVINYYGVRINDITGAATARAYSSNVTAGTGKYGLYFSGTANNYLNGNLGIGTLTPSQKLEVTGNIQANGNVYIGNVSALGPINTSYLLNVAGPIRANQITVNMTGADFVFDPYYKLKPLKELESFVIQNHHLPEIESSKNMQKNGVNIGSNQTKLLQKVEELTLYLIDQNKQIQELKHSVNELEKDNQRLKKGLKN